MAPEAVEKVETEFRRSYAEQPLIIRSPGRVNLIGEHTDYNLGYVLPAAIDRAIYFAITPRDDQQCKIQALDKDDEYQFHLGHLEYAQTGWPNYLMGVVDQLVKRDYKLRGFNCVFSGDIPIGAGLSSSAALETGLAFALNRMFGLDIDALALVKFAQKAENDFVGVRCGIMDQYANIFGKRNTVIRLDCRSLESSYYPFDFHDVSIVLFDSGVPHSLASSEYNRRRQECADGVRAIKSRYPHVTNLRDVDREMIQEFRDKMKPVIYQRCNYVIEENERVLRATSALEQRDLQTFGSLLKLTHGGLRDEYQVSCDELDFLVDSMKTREGVYGSRMMGAGFGGCTINLIESEEIERISREVGVQYKRRFGVELKTFVTEISSGTDVVRADERNVPQKRDRFPVTR